MKISELCVVEVLEYIVNCDKLIWKSRDAMLQLFRQSAS